MIVQREKFVDVIPEVLPLARINFAEVEEDLEAVPFDLNIAGLINAETEGRVVVFTIRNGGELIGYSMFLLDYIYHSQHVRQAINDVFYVHPHHRGRAAIQLFDFCEQELKNLGIPVIVYNTKTRLDWSSLLSRRGFKKIEVVWRKVLGE